MRPPTTGSRRPQQLWAAEQLDGLALRGDEVVLDAGCGSGKVTLELAARVPNGRVYAVDAAPSMVEHARQALGDRATVSCQDLVELELPEPVDLVFSNATFHWIPDHDALFAALHRNMKPGARLLAQCGGKGNIDRFRKLADEVAFSDRWARYFDGWIGPLELRDRGGDRDPAGAGRVHRCEHVAAGSPDRAGRRARVRLDRLPRQAPGPDPRRAPRRVRRRRAGALRGAGRARLRAAQHDRAPWLRAAAHASRLRADRLTCVTALVSCAAAARDSHARAPRISLTFGSARLAPETTTACADPLACRRDEQANRHVARRRDRARDHAGRDRGAERRRRGLRVRGASVRRRLDRRPRNRADRRDDWTPARRPTPSCWRPSAGPSGIRPTRPSPVPSRVCWDCARASGCSPTCARSGRCRRCMTRARCGVR